MEESQTVLVLHSDTLWLILELVKFGAFCLVMSTIHKWF
jgi:hypothetical protein